MPNTLRITSTLQLTPLVDIQHEQVAHSYREGVSDSLRHRDEPVPITHLLTCLKRAIAMQLFDGAHLEAARGFVSFHLGSIHGAVLTEHGIRRPDVTTLAMLEDKHALRGYRAGRHFFFEEAQPHERRWTVDYVVERFHELAREAPHWHDDPEGTWQFALACLFGELSGQVFPITPKEQARWEQERQDALAELARHETQAAPRDAQPLPKLLQEA